MNPMENKHSDTSDMKPRDDIQKIGEAILRAKTTLIKPHSKVIILRLKGIDSLLFR